MPFRPLGLDARILKAIEEAGYTEPTPIQSAAIPPILAGHDLIGIAQTGTGKTAAFVLPILTKLAGAAPHNSPLVPAVAGTAHATIPAHNGGGSTVWQESRRPHAPVSRGEGRRQLRALILAPTRELVVQIHENVRAYARHLSLRVATIYGGVSERPQIEALRSGVDLVVATPGRLLDLMNRRFADFSGLNFLVLDEAERMLDMGFLPDIRRIVKALPHKRQTLLFSATLSREIEAVTREVLRNPKTVQIGRRTNPAETVTQFVYEVSKQLKPALLAHLLRDPSLNMVLIFSRMKHSADRIAQGLEAKGIRTATLHSNRSQNQRLRALKDFKSGAVRVLVATDIAARGIDVDGISHVVNYDFPMHPEDYVHRIGRTGRAHAVGDAISFVTPEDQSALRALERFIGRGILRKRSEDFNYGTNVLIALPRDQAERHAANPSHGPRRTGSGRGAGFSKHHGFHSGPGGRGRRWRR
jgi:ATP-dependent RNA helicase RhlE